MRPTSLMVLLMILLCHFLFSQEETPPANPRDDMGWASVGMGFFGDFDVSFVTTLNWGRRKIIQLHYSSVEYLNLFGGIANGVRAVGLNFGISRVNRWQRWSASLGPALVFIHLPQDNNTLIKRTGGLVIKSQYFITPVKELGLGIDVFTILNSTRSVMGLAFTFVLEGNK